MCVCLCVLVGGGVLVFVCESRWLEDQEDLVKAGICVNYMVVSVEPTAADRYHGGAYFNGLNASEKRQAQVALWAVLWRCCYFTGA